MVGAPIISFTTGRLAYVTDNLSKLSSLWLEYIFHISYLQRISTARRPIAQANRKGDAPG